MARPRGGGRPALVAGVAVALATALAWAPARRLYEASPMSWPGDAFDARAWRESPRGERFRFSKDLGARRLVEGRTRAEVFELLGPADREAAGGRHLAYVLREPGGGDPAGAATWTLRVELDARGRVERAFVQREE
jgi:hypothetical protein